MSDLAAAAATALRASGRYVLISGRSASGLQPLAAHAQRHVVSPGPTTRLAVAAGVALGGHRAIAVVDPGCAFAEGYGALAFTESPAAAHDALRSGWAVVQPWLARDVADLLSGAPRPTLVLLPSRAPDLDGDQATPDDPVPTVARATRVWRAGDLATVLAAGPAVAALLRIGRRLRSRGVSVHEVEVPVLTSADHAPLIGGDALYVGGWDAAEVVAGGGWPPTLARVSIDDVDEAELMGRVLSQIRPS